MITAVDANIVLDILTGSPQEIERGDAALRAAKASGPLIVCTICYAEVASNFSSRARADDFFELLDCKVEALDREAAFLAGQFFDQYKSRGGRRTRILADFLIAAHAQLNASRILTRDHRFFGANFPRLKSVTPEDLS